MKRYFVSAMFSAGWYVDAEGKEDAIEKFCKESEDYIDGDIDGSTIYIEEEKDNC